MKSVNKNIIDDKSYISIHKPLICFLMHLPPPVNGVSMVSELVSLSSIISSNYSVTVIPLRFASTTSDIGKFRLAKLVCMAKVASKLFIQCVRRRPILLYFTLTPNGKAFYRDLLFVAIAKILGIRRLYHLHGKGIHEAAGSFVSRLLYRWAFDGAQVILLSPRLMDDAQGIIELENCHFLANGIPDPLEGVFPGFSHTGKQGPPRILFFSNIVVSKGPFVLLEALASLSRDGYDFTATFAGAWESPEVEQKFYWVVSELGLDGKVHYLGPKFGSEKSATFAAADIFAFPTYNDTFPLVILEAMAHGLPVISTIEGAIPDMVVDGETGYLVPTHNVAVLAERLSRLLTDFSLRMMLGQAGRERYESKFTVEKFSKNLLDIFDKCLMKRHMAQFTSCFNENCD